MRLRLIQGRGESEHVRDEEKRGRIEETRMERRERWEEGGGRRPRNVCVVSRGTMHATLTDRQTDRQRDRREREESKE